MAGLEAFPDSTVNMIIPRDNTVVNVRGNTVDSAVWTTFFYVTRDREDKEKVLRAKDQGVSLMIVPKKNLDELQEVEWEKKEDEHYVTESVRGATAFVDLLVLAVQGKFQHVGGPDSSQC